MINKGFGGIVFNPLFLFLFRSVLPYFACINLLLRFRLLALGFYCFYCAYQLAYLLYVRVNANKEGFKANSGDLWLNSVLFGSRFYWFIIGYLLAWGLPMAFWIANKF